MKFLSIIAIALSTLSLHASSEIEDPRIKEILDMKYTDLVLSNIFDKAPAAKAENSLVIVGDDSSNRLIDTYLYDKKGKLLDHSQFITQKEGERYRVRVLGGYFTEENFNSIVRGNIGAIKSTKTSVMGVEIGRVLIHGFRDWPVNIVTQIGLYQHDDKKLQENSNFNSVAGMIKFEWYKFPWSNKLRTKIDFSEGMNYVQRIPYEEGLDVRAKNNGRDSHLLNYLGFSVGVNLGDLISNKNYENCYIGGYVYHRSGVFGLVPLYNNINGGSNFQTLYLECSH